MEVSKQENDVLRNTYKVRVGSGSKMRARPGIKKGQEWGTEEYLRYQKSLVRVGEKAWRPPKGTSWTVRGEQESGQTE